MEIFSAYIYIYIYIYAIDDKLTYTLQRYDLEEQEGTTQAVQLWINAVLQDDHQPIVGIFITLYIHKHTYMCIYLYIYIHSTIIIVKVN